ncbi:MAG: DUF2165 domain-containing protein [Gammaproteobacteria bacterium]|nr:DUF2165 domain-containing protein [Gammaproteobacteria bacterium]
MSRVLMLVLAWIVTAPFASAQAAEPATAAQVREWIGQWGDKWWERYHPDYDAQYPGGRSNRFHDAYLDQVFKRTGLPANTNWKISNKQYRYVGDWFIVEWLFQAEDKASGKLQREGTLAFGRIRDDRLITWIEYFDGYVAHLQRLGRCRCSRKMRSRFPGRSPRPRSAAIGPERMLDVRQPIRWSKAVIALMPALLGTFALFNNVSDYTGTVRNVLQPILCMQQTFDNPQQTWRAICSPPVFHLVYLTVMAVEALIAVLGWLGVLSIVRALRQPAPAFAAACGPTTLACLIGIAVWGIGFFVIIGDWFLVWQGALKPFATDGVAYSTMMLICLFAVNLREDH